MYNVSDFAYFLNMVSNLSLSSSISRFVSFESVRVCSILVGRAVKAGFGLVSVYVLSPINDLTHSIRHL
jgi:hypothetical protein